MKLLSIKQLAHHARRTYLRFPFALLSAALGTSVAITLVESPATSEKGVLINLLISAALGLPLFITIPILAEKLRLAKAANVLSQAAGALLLVGYFFSLPADVFSSPEFHAIRFFLLNLALHLLVAIAPYFGKNQINGFWQFNKNLFLRFLTAALYSGALYAGLSIALASVDHLFEIDVDEKRYGELWILIAGMFNTWFFLAGVPENLDELNNETSYPKGLKIFTQYVLLPLVVVYLIILYAYEGRIIFEWEWPKGLVANLVLGFSVTGILALLLVYPVQQYEENKWIKTFGRWYYVALIPLVIMLLLAIWRRISDYGVTENRYFVLVLGACLGAIVIYFIFSRAKNIKIIPITLCGVSFFAAFGPWGAFAVSERSQKSRLEALFVKNEILVDGFVQKSQRPVPFTDTKEISSVVNYLHKVHGLSAIQPWFKQDLRALIDSGSAEYRQTKVERVVALMGISFVNEWQIEMDHNFSFNAKTDGPIAIAGYEYLVQLNDFTSPTTTPMPIIDRQGFTMLLDFDGNRATLTIYQPGSASDSIVVRLAPLVEDLIEEFGVSPANHSLPAEKMVMEYSGRRLKAKIYFSVLRGQKVDDQVTIGGLQADLLLGRRDN